MKEMGFQAHHDERKALWQVSSDGKLLLEYVYGEKEDPNPSFRVVRTEAGHDIALYRPWDHPWHLGVFFSWKYINGLNFWESTYHGQANVAVTDVFRPLSNGRTGFQQSLSYISHEGKTLLKEERVIEIVPAENGYSIQWEGSFSSVSGDVELNRTEVTEQTPWGGYAGLSCRLNRNFLGPIITTDKGKHTADEAHGSANAWCDYSGKIDGYTVNPYAGICIMDDPANLRHPINMLTYDYKDMQFLHAAFLYDEAFKLREGEVLRLRYNCYVHDGEAVPDLFSKIYRESFK